MIFSQVNLLEIGCLKTKLIKLFLRQLEEAADHPIEEVGKQLRAMMPWITANRLVDKDKNYIY